MEYEQRMAFAMDKSEFQLLIEVCEQHLELKDLLLKMKESFEEQTKDQFRE